MKRAAEWIAEMDADVSPVLDAKARGDIVARWIVRIQQDAIGSHSRSAKVAEFHRLVGQPVLETPQVPADDRVRLRAKLLFEESVKEFFVACFELGPGDQCTDMFRQGMHFVSVVIDLARVRVDLVAAADALADTAYVTEGAFHEFGIGAEEVFDEVHRSNLEKAPPCGRCYGAGGYGPDPSPDGTTHDIWLTCEKCEGRKCVANVRADGKVQKPKGWRPPDVAGVLNRQGRKL